MIALTSCAFVPVELPMHKSRLATIVIDCETADVARAADFWSQALGYVWNGGIAQ